MSGKPYTMKEMKVIVEYVTERKAFGEVKGRKMWMDFANTELTFRTWQSLKETFLKRILPDIHNPYYKLTMDQIRSFKEGCDVAEKKSKLEIVNLDEDSNSNSNAENQGDNEKPSTSKANKGGGGTSGEEVTCSKVQNHDRASVDTVIIPTCYETAEDIQRALESPLSTTTNENVADLNNKTPPTKSIRDLITYSEPLTPMLQEVLHDFATDEDSDAEGRMQIVEDPVPDSEPQLIDEAIVIPDTETQSGPTEPPPIEILDSEDVANKNTVVNEDEVVESTDIAPPKILSLKLKKRKGGYKIDKKKKTDKASKCVSEDKIMETVQAEASNERKGDVSEICNTNEKTTGVKEDTHVSVPEKTTSNLSNSADTILPNNQEALGNTEKNMVTSSQDQTESEVTLNKIDKDTNEVKGQTKTRKRAISQEVSSSTKIKKSLLDSRPKIREKAVSDNDTVKKNLKASKGDNYKPNFIGRDNQVKIASHVKDDTKNVSNSTKTGTEQPSSSKVETDDLSADLSQLNPCLKSVSLFAEQFNKVSYIESENEEEISSKNDEGKKKIDENTKKPDENKKKDKNMNEVVILKSHSESESEHIDLSPKNNAHDSRVTKVQRDKVLANVFGFSSGAVGTKRKRDVGYKKSSNRYPRKDSSGDSSEWTSESDSEAYVSPPRGRRNRHTRKYLKPHSARILSLEDEGGLFVMYGKKIYPLVKDGKIVKNYLTYLPESDPEEEEESYWKTKYVEERQRVEELKKIVDLNQEKTSRGKSPILPGKSIRNTSVRHEQRSPAKKKTYEQEHIPVPIKENMQEVNDKGKTLKITFAKNNQEVHVEGHWSNIHPVLAEVVQIFNKDTEPAKEYRPNGNIDLAKHSDASSDKSVAIVPIIDKAVHEKVSKLETEIFKEIEKRDLEEEVEMKEPSEVNVTKRKRAPRRRSSSNQSTAAQKSATSSPRSPKQQKTSELNGLTPAKDTATTEQKSVEDIAKSEQKSIGKKLSKTESKAVSKKKTTDKKKEEQKIEENNNDNVSVQTANSTVSVRTRRQTKTPKKDEKEAVTQSTKAKSAKASKTTVPSPQEEEDQVRYMFPPAKKPVKSPKSALSLSKTRENKRYMPAAIPKIYSSPNFPIHSESTQGYQDSDISPPRAIARRKRKLSLTTALSKIRHRSHRSLRRSLPIITNDISSDSNGSTNVIIRPISTDSTLKSEAYRTDSYQLLFRNSRNVFRNLEKIDEDLPLVHDKRERSFKTSTALNVYKASLDINMNSDFVYSSNGVTDGGNSSNVSLPLSPELSIVENISISKELMNSIPIHPNLNELQSNKDVTELRNKYLMSQIDVSMPLMQQDCNFCPNLYNVIKTEPNYDETMPPALPDSLLNKINIVNIEDPPSLSESLDTRLKNLLLESAKKMSMPLHESNKEVQKETAEPQKKSKSGKRCSTPQKRKGLQKKKLKVADPIAEDEYTESCSYGGRNSCPPVIQLITAENNVSKENVNVNIDNNNSTINEKSKGRRKKDVIKVKILRPRSKTRKQDEVLSKKSDVTVHNDSGINETQSIISNQGFNDSVDLIHNHSETCLHANECLPDSIEFVDNATSIISLNSESISNERSIKDMIVFEDCEELEPEFFCHNAQDGNVNAVRHLSRANTDTSETVFHSPILSDTSLITEDLSDDLQPTQWYLLSEDDTQTANANVASNSGFGANLKQIFPITCSVPNLSTITEMSNENSRKPTMESDTSTRHDLDSQSLFPDNN